MGVVGKGFVLSGPCASRIVYERELAVFVSECLEECACHVVDLYYGHMFPLCHRAHGVGIVAVSLDDVEVVLVPSPSLCGCAEDYVSAFGSHLIYKYLKVVLEIVPCTSSGAFFFLVVVSELTEDIIAFFECSEDFFQSVAGEE